MPLELSESQHRTIVDQIKSVAARVGRVADLLVSLPEDIGTVNSELLSAGAELERALSLLTPTTDE